MAQALSLRPLQLTDLPLLRYWRGLPSVQQHLRHPKQPTPLQQLRWWWKLRSDPTAKVWAVTLHGRLVGQAGFYYRTGTGAEVSVLVMDGDTEDFEAERLVVRTLLPLKAVEWGLTSVWAEVLSTAPLLRHFLFPQASRIWADSYSTLYRWSL